MKHIHRQHQSIDYRLRMPQLACYAIAAGSASVALGAGYRATIPTNRLIANGLIGVGVATLAPALGLFGLVRLLQNARDRLRDTILESVSWRGDERVLDIGTGSGVLLFACAKHLSTGTATGIDIYEPIAGGGSAQLFWRNARAEGVADRVRLRNIDARQMSFANETFDVAVSSLAMHHVGTAHDRQRATAEIVRTLKSGGSIALCDFTTVIRDCEHGVRQHGMVNVRRGDFLHLFSVLTAEK